MNDAATPPAVSEASGRCAPAFVDITITSSPRCLPVVRAAVTALAEEEGFGANESHSLVWAVDEALTNVIRHGYQNRPDQPISIRLEPVCSQDGRAGVRIVMRDFGRQVSPESIRGRDLDDIRPGGLGVHIIRSVMSEVNYSCPSDGGMLLTMVKFVDKTTPSAGECGPEARQDVEGPR